MEVYLTDKAFLSIVLSGIEVYRDEVLGVLLGYELVDGDLVVEYAIPYQTAKRSKREVEPIRHREIRVLNILDRLTNFHHLGYFHSHTEFRGERGVAELSDPDKESLDEGMIELIIAINDAKRKFSWRCSDTDIYGSIDKFHIHLACFKKESKGKIIRVPISCPYILGLSEIYEL